VEFVIRKGRPATEIVKFTRENNTDLVIVGVKGRSALEVVFLGSVARDVVNHAPCPVLVVRPVEHDFIE
jgi:universal stress protein A